MLYILFLLASFFVNFTLFSQVDYGSYVVEIPSVTYEGLIVEQAEFFKDFKRALSARTSSQFPRDSVQTAVSEGVNCGYKQAVEKIMKLVCPARLNLVKILITTLEDYYNPEREEPEYEEEQEKIAATLKVVLNYTRGHINDYWQEKSPLKVALKRQNAELVQLLLSYGAKPNGSRRTFRPLHEAALAGNSKLVTMLLFHGADPNKLDFFGNTILSKLKKLGKQPEMVELLEKAGAQERVINYKRLSKIMGLDVGALPSMSSEEQAKIVLKLNDKHLTVLCLISDNYYKLVKGILAQINSFNLLELSSEQTEVLATLPEAKGMPLLWELEACRCGLDILNYAKMQKKMKVRLLSLQIKRLLVLADLITAERA